MNHRTYARRPCWARESRPARSGRCRGTDRSVDESVVVGRISSMPNEMSEQGRPLIVAGFQCIAPAESMGQAVAAPAIDSFTGLTPRNAIPCPIASGPVARIPASRTPAVQYFRIVTVGLHMVSPPLLMGNELGFFGLYRIHRRIGLYGKAPLGGKVSPAAGPKVRKNRRGRLCRKRRRLESPPTAGPYHQNGWLSAGSETLQFRRCLT